MASAQITKISLKKEKLEKAIRIAVGYTENKFVGLVINHCRLSPFLTKGKLVNKWIDDFGYCLHLKRDRYRVYKEKIDILESKDLFKFQTINKSLFKARRLLIGLDEESKDFIVAIFCNDLQIRSYHFTSNSIHCVSPLSLGFEKIGLLCEYRNKEISTLRCRGPLHSYKWYILQSPWKNLFKKRLKNHSELSKLIFG